MHFGEYLVQQKILSAHQILKALGEQRKQRKFIPLLLVELGAMPDFQALKFCTMADRNFEDFVEVLLREGCISEEQCTQIRHAWMSSGPPLGRVLVELGFMNEETRKEVLGDFEAEKELEQNLGRFAQTGNSL